MLLDGLRLTDSGSDGRRSGGDEPVARGASVEQWAAHRRHSTSARWRPSSNASSGAGGAALASYVRSSTSTGRVRDAPRACWRTGSCVSLPSAGFPCPRRSTGSSTPAVPSCVEPISATPRTACSSSSMDYAYHSDSERFQSDRDKQNATQALGWKTLRFTWADVTRDPDRTARTVARMLDASVLA